MKKRTMLSAVCAFTLAMAPAAVFAAGTGPAKTDGDFALFGYDYGQTRQVPFKEITKENVKELGRVWSVDFQKEDKEVAGGQETFPLVVDGVLYATTGFDQVYAMDAASGKVLWHWKPDNIGAFKNFGLNVNRGVAYGEGKVYLLTLDCKLVALDAKTGQLVKSVNLSDAIPDASADKGYYETTAPIYYDGKLYIGSSGGDNGVRGFIMAYKASDLTAAWAEPYWTVPPAGQGWRAAGKFHGGGAVWMPATIDTETGTLYASVGNPSPDFFGESRPGANPNTDSVVAIDAKTGKEKWVGPEITKDLWDYDAGAAPMLMTATVGGNKMKIVVEGSKGGQWYAWDAATGKKIYDGVPFTKIDHPEPTDQGVVVYPGVLGGENYAPETYDPATNYVLIPGINYPMTVKKGANLDELDKDRKEGDIDFGTSMADAAGIKPTGNISALDVNTGKIVYQKDTPEPMRGGFTSTVTGLAFYGDGNGTFNAIDIKTGENLWSFQTGAQIAAAPTIYEVGGKEYLAIATGGTTTSSNGGKVSHLDVFALGGNKNQDKAPSTTAENSGGKDGKSTLKADDKATWLTTGDSNTVNLGLIGSLNGANGSMNFNGYANGQMKVKVPTGSTVHVDFQNANAQMPHSVMIVPQDTKGKTTGFQAAFPNAQTPDPLAGFVGSQTQSFEFKADKAGTYLIWCAIPGHGTAGMWDELIVDDAVKQPVIDTPDGAIQAGKASASSAGHGAAPASPAPAAGNGGSTSASQSTGAAAAQAHQATPAAPGPGYLFLIITAALVTLLFGYFVYRTKRTGS